MKTTRYQIKDRLLALLIAFLMVMQIMPVNVLAEGERIRLQSEPVRGQTYAKVDFIDSENGNQLHQLIAENGTIEVMPEKPFKEGRRFVEWNTKQNGSGETVTVGYEVTGNMNVYAIFESMTVYEVAVKYWYTSNTEAGGRHYFETQVFQFEAADVPYTINCPANVNQESAHTSDQTNPIYYPTEPTITITEADLANATASGDGSVLTLPTQEVQYVPYTATYDFVYMLKDLSGDGYTEFDRETVQGVKGSTVSATVKDYPHYTFERTTPVEIVQATGTEILVYYIRDNVTLTYDSHGGSYVAPVNAVYGQSVSVSSANPTRTGYIFKGWYDAEEGGNKITGSMTLEGDITLHAHWVGQEVNYTIVYMFEKYNDAGTEASFVYDNSEKKTATVGTTVHATDSSIPDKTRTGWEKDTAQNQNSSVEIAPDGSSVLYVYYKLREYTFQFNAGIYLLSNVTATLVGKNVSGNGNLNYTMKVKLGQNISSTWPGNVTGTCWILFVGTIEVGFNGWENPQDGVRYVTDRTTVTSEMLPNNGATITYTAQWTSFGRTYIVNYWLQNADDDEYTKSEIHSQTYTSSSGNLGAKEISGFTYDHGNSGESTTTYNFYYNRDTYNIDYYYGGTLLDTIEGVKFDANINKAPYTWTPTQAQCGVDSDYTWGGWQSNAGLTVPYSFDKMPANSLAVYAKWNPPTYTVSFDLNYEGATDSIDNQEIEKNKTATSPVPNPTRENYTFRGWFTDAACTNRYDFAAPVTEDITLFAKWEQNPLTYIVHYVDENGGVLYPDKTVTSPLFKVGESISETAVTIAGLTPDAGSKSIELSFGTNEITFVYSSKIETTSYTVQYVLASNHDVKVHADKVVDNVSGNTVSVIELAASADKGWMGQNGYSAYTDDDYYPVEDVKELVLSSNTANNVLIFEYNNFITTKFTINYLDMGGLQITNPKTEHLRIGDTYTVDTDDIPGTWVYHHVVASDGRTVTQYMVNDGNELTINVYYQKKLTITANNLEKDYDGTPLNSQGINDITVDGLKPGHSITGIGFDGSQTDVGVSATTPKAAIISGPTVADYYSIEYVPGTLRVKPVAVTITIDPDRWNGNYYTGSEYKTGFTNSKKTIDDYVSVSNETYKSAYQATIWNTLKTRFPNGVVIAETDAGEYTVTGANIFQESDLPNTGENYIITLYVRNAALEIKPVELTVTTGSNEKTYDGTPLTDAEAEITGFVNNETATVTATGTITEIGAVPNNYSISWGTAKSKNYTIKEELGTLTVTAATLSVTVKNRTTTYNGEEQTGYTITEVTGTGSTIDRDNYTVTGLAENDVLTVTYTPAAGTDAGTYENGTFGEEVTYTITRNGTDVSKNYGNPSFAAGKLIIEPAALTVTVTGNNDTVTYTGEEQSVSGYEISIPEGATLTEAEISGPAQDAAVAKGTNVDGGSNADKTYPMGLTTEAFSTTNTNYTVTFAVTDGWLKIEPAPLKITAFDQTYVYNGSAQGEGDPAYEDSAVIAEKVKADGLKGKDAITSITLDGQGTNIGEYADLITANAAEIGNATDNYEITYVPGKLTIKARPVTFTATSETKEYTGDTITINGLTVSNGENEGLVSGHTHNVTFSASGTEADTYEGTITEKDAVVIKSGETDVTKNYDITVVNGKLTITKTDAEFIISLADDEYTYDSKAHANAKSPTSTAKTGKTTYSYSFEQNGTYADDLSSLTKIDAGEYTIYVKGTNLNYNKTATTTATLTINPLAVTVTITGNIDTQVYSGSEQQTEGYDVKIDNDLYTEDDFAFSGTDIAKGTDVGNYEMGLDADQFANTNPNFDVAFDVTDGELNITKRIVTLTSANGEKVYDGTALTKNSQTDVTVGGDGFAADEGATYSITGTQTEVGSSANAFTYTLNEGTKAGNYDISKTEGTLTVTALTDKVTVTITEHSGSEKYDGSEKTVTGYDAAISNKLYKEADFTFSGDATVKGTDAGSYPMELKAADFTNNSKNITNVEFVIVDGTLEIAKRTVTLTSATDSKVYDETPLTNDKVTVTGDGFAEKDGAAYDVTGIQTLVGSSENKFTYTLNEGTKAANYEIATAFGTLTVTDGENEGEDPVDPSLVVTKTAEEGPYALGDEVTFTITATNIYEAAQTINLSEIEGVTLAKSSFENVAGGEKITTTAVYTIAEKDILNGSFTNTVTAKMGSITKTADATVTTEKKNGHLTITKETTSKAAAEDGKYALGEKITYKITALNDGNLTITGITVADELTGDEWTIDSLAPNASEEFTAEYTVTEADILAGEVVNVATAKGTSPDPDEKEVPVEPGRDPEPTEDKKGHLTINKETTSKAAAEDGKYALGEKITYRITALNDGNLTITDITVADELTGDEWTIDSLAPNASREFTAEYTVTEADILAGEVVNVATGKGTSPDPDEKEVPVEPGTDPEPTEEKKGHLTITKETTSKAAAEDGKYALGEKITYKITALNDGNLTITGITVTDELTGDEWTIDSLAPNTSEEFTAEYTVTEADILAGEVVNVAIGKGTSPDPDEKEVPVEPGTDPEPTEDKNGHMTVTKTTTSKPADEAGYALGETIEYQIVVTNDGNLTMTNITVEDNLTGMTETIESLAPGQEETFTTTYVVTAQDVEAGSVVNEATATGSDPEDKEVPGEPGTDTEPVIRKYRLTVNYWMNQVGGERAANTFTAEYTAGAEYNVASPILAGFMADKERVTGTITADTTVDVVYTMGEFTLTIYYVYADGTQAAPTYQRTLAFSEAYSVLSPVIDGYTANFRLVTGEMPARNMAYTIRYQAAGDGTIIDDYDTPLGLAGLGMCTGETYE